MKVAITVMSFDEPTYQLLSGTNLPITRIENNLRFVKKLREQEIVNYFEIATVVQERNFRTVPEFARRCVEEFGADYVRLRPYMPWGSQEPEIEWFMDIRNPEHPYYGEYKEMKKDIIFKHPRVFDWSGGRDSVNIKTFPYKSSYLKEKIISDILSKPSVLEKKIREYANKKQIVIYGLGIVGKILVRELKERGIEPVYMLDKFKVCSEYENIKVYNLEETEDILKDVRIIITPLMKLEEIKKELELLGYRNEKMHIKQLVEE